MKKCTGCFTEKPLANFYDKKRSKARKDGTIHSWVGKYAKCKKCTDKTNNIIRPKYDKWYKDYRIENKEKIRVKSQKHYVNNMVEWVKILSTLKELKCSCCGYDKSYAALDFHHRIEEDKIIAIHSITKSGVPTPERVELLKSEIEKCDVLCSNCHREHHSKYDYFKLSAEKIAKVWNK